MPKPIDSSRTSRPRTRKSRDKVERDGSTPARAIREDQNAWRRRHLPGYTLVMQMLTVEYCDRLTLESEDGQDVRVVYFDVSSIFGKGMDRLVARAVARAKKGRA
jgi:hypothetical protein